MLMKSIDEDKHENKIYRITEYYTKSYTITKFRHAHMISLIFVNMCILPHEKKKKKILKSISSKRTFLRENKCKTLVEKKQKYSNKKKTVMET